MYSSWQKTPLGYENVHLAGCRLVSFNDVSVMFNLVYTVAEVPCEYARYVGCIEAHPCISVQHYTIRRQFQIVAPSGRVHGNLAFTYSKSPLCIPQHTYTLKTACLYTSSIGVKYRTWQRLLSTSLPAHKPSFLHDMIPPNDAI